MWNVSSILFPSDINSFASGGLPSGEPSCPQNLPRVFLSAEIWWRKDKGWEEELLKRHVPGGRSVKVLLSSQRVSGALLLEEPAPGFYLPGSGCCNFPPPWEGLSWCIRVSPWVTPCMLPCAWYIIPSLFYVPQHVSGLSSFPPPPCLSSTEIRVVSTQAFSIPSFLEPDRSALFSL